MKILCLLLIGYLPLHAQEWWIPPGPLYGKAAAYGFLPAYGITLSQHPASIRRSPGWEVVGYQEWPFGKTDWSLRVAGVITENTAGRFGFFCSQFTGPLYLETSPGLSYARKAGNRMSLGWRVNHHRLKTPMTLRSGNSIQMGWLWDWLPSCRIGMRWDVYKMEGQKGLMEAEAGMCWKASPLWQVAAVYKLAVRSPPGWQVELNYQPLPVLFIDAGCMTTPGQWFMGIGWRRKKGFLSVMGKWHPALGWSPGLQGSFFLLKSKEHETL